MQVSNSDFRLSVNNRNRPLGTFYTDKEIVNGIIAVVKWHYSDLPSGNQALDIVKSRCQNFFHKVNTKNFSTANLTLNDYINFSKFFHLDVLDHESYLNRLCNRRTVIVNDTYFELWSSDQRRYMTNKFQTITLSGANESLTIDGNILIYESDHSFTEIKLHYIAKSALYSLQRVIDQEKKVAAEWKRRSEAARIKQQQERARIQAVYRVSIQKHFKDTYGFFINKDYRNIQYPTPEEQREIRALDAYKQSISHIIDNMKIIDNLYEGLTQALYKHRHSIWDIVAGKQFTQTQTERMAYLKLAFFELAKTACKRNIIMNNYDPLINKTSDLRNVVRTSFLIDHHRCSRWSPARLGKTKLRRALEQRMQFQDPATNLNLHVVQYIPIPGMNLRLFIPRDLQINSADRNSYFGALMERRVTGGYDHGLSIQVLMSCRNFFSRSNLAYLP